MSRYIKSEFYRLLHYKWSYLFVVICSVLLLSSNIVLAAVKHSDSKFPYANTAFAFGNFYSNYLMVFFLCILVANMVFGNEHSNHTMKNTVSYGISRVTIYFGKLLVQVTFAVIAFSLIMGSHILSSYLLLEHSAVGELELLLRSSLACIPLFLFALAVTNCFAFTMESSSSAISTACCIMLVIPIVTNLLGMRFELFNKITQVMPLIMIKNVNISLDQDTINVIWGNNVSYSAYWFIGILEMLIFVVLGLVLFNKKEIK
ncbi:MAG: transporter permease [Herbinix sp.]|jgi:ABC-type transport system involved in multi-copper enzyme maturation permease subunit|nr:transporter permease [Herbinix sp.]